MKKVLLPILSLLVAMGLVLPATAPVAANTSSMTYIGMNLSAVPFGDARVRMAVYVTLDRDAIAASQGGTKVVSVVTPSVPDPSVNRSNNITLAKRLLSEAGYPNGFQTNLASPNLMGMVNLAQQIKAQLYAVGINATVEALDPAVFSTRLSNHQLPFFLTSTLIDLTFLPAEALGRLLLSGSPQNYTGYSRAEFDTLFNARQYVAAEYCAFDPVRGGLPIIPLFYRGTPFYTVRVVAGPATAPGIPVQWSKTGGSPFYSGTGTTPFNIFSAAGNVTLAAPLTCNRGTQFYVFRRWLVGTPPAPPELSIDNTTVTFSASADKQATASYQQITTLGLIYPTEADVNPVGIEHRVWVNIGIPVAGVRVNFNINGANAPASGSAWTDATGEAAFTYTGSYAGVDNIYAYIDGNRNGQYDPGEPRSPNTNFKSWVENRITGAGTISDGDRPRWTFDVNLRVLPEGGVDGRFNIVNHETNTTYRLDRFSVLFFSGDDTRSPVASNNTTRFRATGTGSDGSLVTLVVIIEDAGEPGAGNDRIAVVEIVSSPPPPAPTVTRPWIGVIPFPPPTPPAAPTLVTIDGGNFQIHNVQLRH